jgi:small subunit ribosomal protein S3
MAVVKHFISEAVKKTEIDEFLKREFEKAGYGGVDITKTPLGTHIVVYAMRPGIIIGRGGGTIKELAILLEQKFGLPNPQISVAEIEVPEFNAFVIASRVSSALKRGVHFRRAGFWALQQVMETGALGAEIIIGGKLRTERARYEKFRAGYLPKSGYPALKNIHKAEVHVQLKQGIFGVKVRIMPSGVKFPDQIEIPKEILEEKTKEKIIEPLVESENAEVKPEISAVEAQKTEEKQAEEAQA